VKPGHAGLLATLGCGRIVLAGPIAVAQSVCHAGGRTQILADIVLIGRVVGHVQASPGRAGQVAALAGAGTTILTAHAVHALARQAFAGARARLPILLRAARASSHSVHGFQHTLVSRRAVRVELADSRTRGIGAKEGRAVQRMGVPTGALAVAGPGCILAQARARRGTAHRVFRVERARAKAVTNAGVAAGGGIAASARGVVLASRDGRAVAHRPGLVTRHAGTTTREAAAHPVRAEPRVTLIGRIAERAVGALAAPSRHTLMPG
jgi:hypothetical protein